MFEQFCDGELLVFAIISIFIVIGALLCGIAIGVGIARKDYMNTYACKGFLDKAPATKKKQ